VDEKDHPVKYYATNRFHIYNEKDLPRPCRGDVDIEQE
jgi:hypothetical protein